MTASSQPQPQQRDTKHSAIAPTARAEFHKVFGAANVAKFDDKFNAATAALHKTPTAEAFRAWNLQCKDAFVELTCRAFPH